MNKDQTCSPRERVPGAFLPGSADYPYLTASGPQVNPWTDVTEWKRGEERLAWDEGREPATTNWTEARTKQPQTGLNPQPQTRATTNWTGRSNHKLDEATTNPQPQKTISVPSISAYNSNLHQDYTF